MIPANRSYRSQGAGDADYASPWQEYEETPVASNISRVCQHLSNSPPFQQIIIGTSVGWCSAALYKRVQNLSFPFKGRIFIPAIAGSLCLILLANTKGYIIINWMALKEDLENAKEVFEKSICNEHNEDLICKIKNFVVKNGCILFGYFTGFVLGINFESSPNK